MTEFLQHFGIQYPIYPALQNVNRANQNKPHNESACGVYKCSVPLFEKQVFDEDNVAIDIEHDLSGETKVESYIPKPQKYFDCKNMGFGENQDFCQIGRGFDKFETIEIGNAFKEFEYIVVCDGHGDKDCYNYYFKPILNEINFSDLLGCENPVDAIICYIESRSFNCIQQYQVGATLSIAKIYKTENNIKVVCYNMGDSRTKVFWNNELVYSNRPHVIMQHYENKRLQEKLMNRYAIICPSYKYVMFDENTLMRIENPRTSFYSHNKYWSIQLVQTQCIGHHGITGSDPEIFEMSFAIKKGTPFKFRVCVFSNGVDEMTMESSVNDNYVLANMSCDEILKMVENRWRKKWRLILQNKMGIHKNNDNSDYLMSFGSSLDDCSIGVWSYSI